MSKIYLSADIEGVCGVAHWDDTELGKPVHAAAAAQMTQEVAAACRGALKGGAAEVFVKDAHDSARNLDPRGLPRQALLLRGWTGDPLQMMAGLDDTFSGVFFTGYHTAAGTNGNPLAHTMDTDIMSVKINGLIASELMMNCYTAAMFGVPVRMLTGDKMLCEWMQSQNPSVQTVAVSQGVGGASVCIHPDVAVERIEKAAETAMGVPAERLLIGLPAHFSIEVSYQRHSRAYRSSFFPGARQTAVHRVSFETDSWDDALRFFLFCL